MGAGGAFNRPNGLHRTRACETIGDITSAHFWELVLLSLARLPAVDEEHIVLASSHGAAVVQN